MKKETKETLGIIGQYGCLIMVVFAILYEIVTGAHLGYIMITAFGILYAVFVKIRGK